MYIYRLEPHFVPGLVRFFMAFGSTCQICSINETPAEGEQILKTRRQSQLRRCRCHPPHSNRLVQQWIWRYLVLEKGDVTATFSGWPLGCTEISSLRNWSALTGYESRLELPFPCQAHIAARARCDYGRVASALSVFKYRPNQVIIRLQKSTWFA